MKEWIGLTRMTPATIVPLLLLLVLTLPADGQISPLVLKVTKKVTYSTKTDVGYSVDGYGGNYGIRESSRTVSHTRNPSRFSIEVVNNSLKKFDDVKIKWTLLVQASGDKEETLEQGDKAFGLESKKKFTCDVHAADSNAEAVGCSVELYVGDSPVASDTQPASAKERITKLTGAKRE